MTMEQLVLAGAPELPEGWFYRVREDRFGWPEVEIREHRRRFGSRQHTYALVRLDDYENVHDAVVAACVTAREKLHVDFELREKFRALGSYIGDHDGRRG
ncbi:hypothetical protein GCM10009548_02040 [Streptomyces malaysiensis subsp. malaysiensis]|uniref:Uncharacterized protein n=1 Tax=Streptomyces malaysiensis TaxID=92644 RepID=A0ABX6W7G3_STRMQ|nr:MULTISPECIES: hypothetical protein [Streptomyces]QPI56331.1 hypothetical protein I1A49_16530 [Streptomyces solisilvae]UHH17818.1 hypothetical protein LUV23_16645 [Streptomyces sp. HNM0561]